MIAIETCLLRIPYNPCDRCHAHSFRSSFKEGHGQPGRAVLKEMRGFMLRGRDVVEGRCCDERAPDISLVGIHVGSGNHRGHLENFSQSQRAPLGCTLSRAHFSTLSAGS